jgi:hypothetical protein
MTRSFMMFILYLIFLEWLNYKDKLEETCSRNGGKKKGIEDFGWENLMKWDQY